jgi:hypothetical protein
MFRPRLGAVFTSILALSTFAPASAPQGAQLQPRKPGIVFKEEVDALVGVLTEDAKENGWPLGGESTAARARILVAMARCHRRYYYPGDVPAVTHAVQALIAQRRSDGSFGDGVATAWTVEASDSRSVWKWAITMPRTRGRGTRLSLASVIMASARSMPAVIPAELQILPSRTKIWSGSSLIFG